MKRLIVLSCLVFAGAASIAEKKSLAIMPRLALNTSKGLDTAMRFWITILSNRPEIR